MTESLIFSIEGREELAKEILKEAVKRMASVLEV